MAPPHFQKRKGAPSFCLDLSCPVCSCMSSMLHQPHCAVALSTAQAITSTPRVDGDNQPCTPFPGVNGQYSRLCETSLHIHRDTLLLCHVQVVVESIGTGGADDGGFCQVQLQPQQFQRYLTTGGAHACSCCCHKNAGADCDHAANWVTMLAVSRHARMQQHMHACMHAYIRATCLSHGRATPLMHTTATMQHMQQHQQQERVDFTAVSNPTSTEPTVCHIK